MLAIKSSIHIGRRKVNNSKNYQFRKIRILLEKHMSKPEYELIDVLQKWSWFWIACIFLLILYRCFVWHVFIFIFCQEFL